MKKTIIVLMVILSSCAHDRCPHFAGIPNNGLMASINQFEATQYNDSDIRFMTIRVYRERGDSPVMKFKAWLPVCLGIYHGHNVLCDGRNSILCYKVRDYYVIRSEKQPY
jgi:hypothetical protein